MGDDNSHPVSDKDREEELARRAWLADILRTDREMTAKLALDNRATMESLVAENTALKAALGELLNECPRDIEGESEPRVIMIHVAEPRLERIKALMPKPEPMPEDGEEN